MAKTNHTSILSNNSPIFKRALNQQADNSNGSTHISDKQEVLLVIRGMIERLDLSEGVKYQLGRFEFSKPEDHHIDLTPYGAGDRGVSRIHAQIYLEANQLFITDLNSTNGTFLAGKRLEPDTPTVLRKGDELLLGRLGVQFMYR
jgi:pSer/pThr/pTyr-binding forkhead associated (FHA) protein